MGVPNLKFLKVPPNFLDSSRIEWSSMELVYTKKPIITGLLGLLGIWWDYCLVAMGGLEPPTPAL